MLRPSNLPVLTPPGQNLDPLSRGRLLTDVYQPISRRETSSTILTPQPGQIIPTQPSLSLASLLTLEPITSPTVSQSLPTAISPPIISPAEKSIFPPRPNLLPGSVILTERLDAGRVYRYNVEQQQLDLLPPGDIIEMPMLGTTEYYKLEPPLQLSLRRNYDWGQGPRSSLNIEILQLSTDPRAAPDPRSDPSLPQSAVVNQTTLKAWHDGGLVHRDENLAEQITGQLDQRYNFAWPTDLQLEAQAASSLESVQPNFLTLVTGLY